MNIWQTYDFEKTLIKTKIGKKNQINTSEIKPAGRYPVIDQGQSVIAGYSDEESKVISKELPVIIFGDHTRCFKFVDFPFIIGADGTKILKPKEELFDPKFYYFALLSLKIPNRGYNRHFKLLKEQSVPLPPLPEQKKIAYILSTVQQAIEQQEQIIALTTELKKALMHKLFTEGLRGEPQKETEIGLVPESWNISRFDKFCILQRGFDITKKQQRVGNVPVISSGGISSYHDTAKVKGPGVIIGRKGSLGTVHYVDCDYWPHDTTLWVKDFKGNDPSFTAYFLETLDLKRFDSGAANPTLNRNTVHAEIVTYPQKTEQKEIAKILKVFDQKVKFHEQHSLLLKELFCTLLHQLMTAQIRVYELEFEENV